MVFGTVKACPFLAMSKKSVVRTIIVCKYGSVVESPLLMLLAVVTNEYS